MSNPGRPDSATALARSPLFSHLGRLDLARLAGELEEMHFTPGQPIVREGDRPDGFYVIKYGRAAVLAGVGSTGPSTGDGTRAEPLTTLGPGEVFGEMALLTDSPRTATVVAETDLMVWRLSRARFDTLLDHERGIARSIERSLIHRLTTMNHETGALRALSHRLTAAVLGRLTPGAVRLVAGVAVRPRWSAETLRRTCTKTGDGAALAELVDQTGLLRAEGTDLVVDPTFLAIAGAEVREPNPAWLRAAAEELAAAGDVIAATDLALAAGAVEDAEHLLGTHEARLLESASAGDLDRWLAAVGERSPALGSRLGALRTRLADRRAPARQAAGPGSRERAAPLFSRLAREFTTVRALSALAAVIFFVLGWVLPLPEGLERGGLVTLGAIVATVPLLVADVLPDYVVMLFLTLALVLPVWQLMGLM
jgi:CRP/FNR family transcriptional regulator, cyclic AMP receptor protein